MMSATTPPTAIQVPLNAAIVNVVDLLRAHDRAYLQGYNKGVFIGGLTTIVVLYTMKRYADSRPIRAPR